MSHAFVSGSQVYSALQGGGCKFRLLDWLPFLEGHSVFLGLCGARSQACWLGPCPSPYLQGAVSGSSCWGSALESTLVSCTVSSRRAQIFAVESRGPAGPLSLPSQPHCCLVWGKLPFSPGCLPPVLKATSSFPTHALQDLCTKIPPRGPLGAQCWPLECGEERSCK